MSAGLDSTVATRLAQQVGEVAKAIHFQYGQRAEASELERAAALCSDFQIELKVIELSWFREFSNALTNKARALPTPQDSQLDSLAICKESARDVWVPNRNAVFLSIAAAFAEEAGCDAVIAGFNREEAATFPDNTEAFMESISHTFSFSTTNHVRVLSPTAAWDKSQIVSQAIAFGIDLRKLWSCYESRSEWCGACESCRRLRRALRTNEVDCDAWFENAVAL
jgi:7-cyano-7-deazaguanine synthase